MRQRSVFTLPLSRRLRTLLLVLPVLSGGAGPGAGADPDPIPPYRATIEPIDAALRAAMQGVSWHDGCPVPLEGLRVLTVFHWSFDGEVREGQLIVAAHAAQPLRGVFQAIYEARFPIERIEPVHRYGADDDLSMAANNTSAFNCRSVGGSRSWSRHAYGTAVDVNPLRNPMVKGDRVEPPGGEVFLTRDPTVQGVIVDPGPVTAAFAAAGWKWGGRWRSLKDYQHFSEDGR